MNRFGGSSGGSATLVSVSAHAALRANHRRQVRLLSSRKAGNVRNLSHVISLVDNNYYKQILEGLITCYGVSRMMTASPDQYSPAKALACDSSWPLGGPPPSSVWGYPTRPPNAGSRRATVGRVYAEPRHTANGAGIQPLLHVLCGCA